ncbi:hypothetical protein B9G55_16200 [Saccharibacillus sp. O16]|nr:hypothetical protein B9G55_16200 [Saccharibacillus sp. O16]
MLTTREKTSREKENLPRAGEHPSPARSTVDRKANQNGQRLWMLLITAVLFLTSVSWAPEQVEAASATIDAAKLKSMSRLYFPVRDNHNQLYTLYIFANNEQRRVTKADEIWAGESEGDVIYSGKYRAALLKHGAKVGRVQSVNLNYTTINAMRNESFRLPGDGKSRPDFIFLSETVSSNGIDIYGFTIVDGVLRSVEFAGETGKREGRDRYISPKNGMRGLSENRVQTRIHNNASGQYHFDTYKFDSQTLTLRHIDDLNDVSSNWPKRQGTHGYLDSLKQSALKHSLPGNPRVKIGMTEKQVRAILGKPSEVFNGEWSGYLAYGNNLIGFAGYTQNGKLPAGVRVWELTQSPKFYLDRGQVLEWLGTPTEEYVDEEQGGYVIMYSWKDALLTFFYADEVSPITSFTVY